MVAALMGASSVAAFAPAIQGCYSSTTGLSQNSTDTFNSAGYCSTQCLALAMPVMATKDSTCYCGSQLPPESTSTDNSSCTTSCPGYPSDKCGGSGLYSVWLTGLTYDVTNADASASDTSSSATAKATGKATATGTATASVVTVGGQTVVVTAASSATGTSSASESKSSSGPSKAGIAAGVVIGIVAIAAIAGGAFIFIRNKKRREVEDEYRRNAAVSSFIAGGGKPPNSSGGASSFNDTRLDPAVMAQRRMSDGSIADNQDYSRRILKVTNA